MKDRIRSYAAALMAIVTLNASADEWKWTGAASADWNGAGNWLLNGVATQSVPNEWATVVFETAGEVTVNIPSGTLIASDTMNVKGGGTVNFGGPGEMRIHHFGVTTSSVVFDIPVKLYNNNLHNWSFDRSNLLFKKPVTAAGDRESTFNVTLTDQSPTVGHSIVFEDVLTAPTFNMITQLGWSGDSLDKVKMEFRGKTSLKTFKVGNGYRSGYFHFYASENEILTLSATYGKIFFHAENPLTEGAVLSWNDYWSDSVIPGRYDFADDAVIDRIEATTVKSGAKRQITASAPATLTSKATASVTTLATLGANLSFVYDPLEGFTQAFDANESAIDGTVTVKGGKVQLTTTAKFAQLKSLDIKSGATFELAGTAVGALSSLQTLTIAGTFKVGAGVQSPLPATCAASVADGGIIETDVDLSLAGLTYKGQPVDFKTYETAEWLSPSSKGKVTVLPSGGVEATYNWTGEAGNGKFSDPDNWDSAPVFDSTRTTFVIPQAAATICVDRKVVLNTLSFTSTAAGTVTLTATDGAGFTFSEGSIACAASASVAKSVVLDVPVEFIASMSVTNGSTTDDKTASNELHFTGKICSISTGVMTRSGFGTVYIAGDENAVYGDITASQGETIVAGLDPLGGSGRFLINRSHKLSRIHLTGETIVNRDIHSVWTATDEPFVWAEGVDNVINGKISNSNGSNARIWLANDATLECKGGLDMLNSGYVCYQYGANGRQTLTISEKPLQGNSWFYADLPGSTLILNVANNYVGSGANMWYYAGQMVMGVDQAIKANQDYQMCGTGTPVLDVKSTKQSLLRVFRSASVDANGLFKPEVKNGYVTGTAGGALTLTGDADSAVLPPFQGAVSFESAGTATRTMRRASSSSGTLTVSGGRLVLAAPGEAYKGVAQTATDFEGGAWTNGAVTVSGGTLALNHAKALGKKQVLTVTGGNVEVPSGVTAVVGDLVVNGKPVDIGTYPSGSFGGIVTGGGALYVRGSHPGLVLLFK